jgi:hypothetical protein
MFLVALSASVKEAITPAPPSPPPSYLGVKIYKIVDTVLQPRCRDHGGPQVLDT